MFETTKFVPRNHPLGYLALLVHALIHNATTVVLAWNYYELYKTKETFPYDGNPSFNLRLVNFVLWTSLIYQ